MTSGETKAIDEVATLAEQATALIPGIPGDILPHVIEFLRGLVEGDNARAERAATLATTVGLFDRPRGPKP